MEATHPQTFASLESNAGRRRMEMPGEAPVFLCDWTRALFIHFECDPELLQRELPFALDLRGGRAYASLVAFTMERLRPVAGGRLAALAFTPIATHGFMNVRTYVRHNNEPGIYFLTEWLPNRLSVLLGPRLYGLPYHFGRLEYEHDAERGMLRGRVEDSNGRCLEYRRQEREPSARSTYAPCETGSLPEFLMERYTAYTRRGASKYRFRVWHQPWEQAAVNVELTETSLLEATCGWFKSARYVGANYAPGVWDVWVGRPKRAN